MTPILVEKPTIWFNGNQPTSGLMMIFHGIYGGLMESNGIYHLVMTSSSPCHGHGFLDDAMALIEIDGPYRSL